jgi:Ca2+-binding RTX toxin-like protein
MLSRLLARVAGLTLLVAVACAPVPFDPGEPRARGSRDEGASSDLLANVPLSFVENRGQVPNRDVAYYATTPSASIGFTADGIRFSLADKAGTVQRWGLALDFVGGSASPTARDRQPGLVSYFSGPPSEWKTGLTTHARIVYRNLWPNIDLVYRSDGLGLKYELVVRPGGDPNDIEFKWRGAKDVAVGADGSLTVSTPAGSISDGVPVSFQRDLKVATTYELRGTSYGFRVGAYDPRQPLVIDPVVVFYAGFIGGGDHDSGRAIAVDATGAAYVTGSTDSPAATFPDAVGPDLSYNGSGDAFVAKVDPSGTALVYAGYIGGDQSEAGEGIAVDGAGAAYIIGWTNSDPTTFPATVGPVLLKRADFDAFVAKVNPAGTALSYAGYIGGDDRDFGYDVAVDAAGAAYITGQTASNEITFPDTVGPDFTFNGGTNGDAFVAKVVPSGAGFAYAGYIGGDNDDRTFGIAVDGSGAAYVAGETFSDPATFPVINGPSTTKADIGDAFVAKVNPSGTGLLYSGYIGGVGLDGGQAIAVDASGAAYVAGSTQSDTATFPETVGPFLNKHLGVDAYVAKVNPGGTGLAYAGYIGGDGNDFATGIAVDASGAAYVSGLTESDPATFPETVGPVLTKGEFQDTFVAKIPASGMGLVYAGYIGGNDEELSGGVAVDRAGAAYVTGTSGSIPPSFPATVGPDLTPTLTDAFVAKVTDNLCLGKGVTIQGTADADTLTGTPGNDVILGLGGNDTIDAGGGNDTICAGDGDDLLGGGEGDDALDGEGGADTAAFPGLTPVIVDLAAGTASGASTDTLAGIENLIGSSGKDVLRGNDGPNRIDGGGGGDRLFGRKGSDRLAGQRGADGLQGGRGNDRLFGGNGRDRLNGGKGSRDRCVGGKGTDTATNCEKVFGVP